MHSLGSSLFTMAVVLALIPAALWVVKRLQTLKPAGAPRELELLAQLPLGTRERVVLVRVQGRVLVLGATGAQINLLAEADAAAFAISPALAAVRPADAFSALLASIKTPKGRG